MALTAGTRLGPYEIGAQIGVGGMGEVYRATDTNLARQVAIKVLPESMAADAERLARFDREAKTLAALNHPNIAAIYGLERSDGQTALVMELVEGPTVADRIAEGPIPVDEALAVARQIAEGLEAAHEQGIIHRDLKPANIKLRPDGTVKVLDFGLAKATEPTGALSPGLSQSPTITTPAMTRAGLILGTAAYMAPEQAKGREADKRSDIWAFGCVLFELLAGRRAFGGEDVSDTFAAVLRADPEWSALPNHVPIPIRRLLRRCLQKNRRERLADIGDARLEIQDALSDAREESPRGATTARWSRRQRIILASALAVAVLVAIGGVAWTMRMDSTEPAGLVQLQLFPAGDVTVALGSVPEISPNGRVIAFAGVGGDGISRIFIRALDSPEVRSVAGTEGTRSVTPFWSPDSRELAFHVGVTMKRIAIAGGLPQTVCDQVGPTVVGGSWSRDGVLIFGTLGRSGQPGLMRGSASGGACEPLTRTEPSVNHLFPVFLPDGRHFLYLRNGPDDSIVGSIDAPPEGQMLKTVLKTPQGAHYVPATGSRAGQLLFLRDATLFAQSFDPERLELTGGAVPLAGNIGTLYNIAYFSSSMNGTLVYRTADSNAVQLTWFDSRGRTVSEIGEPVFPSSVYVSPDGTRAVFGSLVPPYGLRSLDLRRGTTGRLGDEGDTGVAWSPGGERIVFSGEGGLYQRVVNGVAREELLLPLPGQGPKFVWDWSRDGRFILYGTNPKVDFELWALPLEGERKPVALGQTGRLARFSPDGRWFAYVSGESGRNEIYVRPFDPSSASPSSEASAKYTISRGNVDAMLGWRKDGRELWYITPDLTIMSVAVTLGRTFDAGLPMPLFQMPPGTRVRSTDGDRFLIGVPTTRSRQVPFTVVQNWPALIRN